MYGGFHRDQRVFCGHQPLAIRNGPCPGAQCASRSSYPDHSVLFAAMLSLVAPWFGRAVILWGGYGRLRGAFGYLYTYFTAYGLSEVGGAGKRGALVGSLFSMGFWFCLWYRRARVYVASFLIVAGCVVLIGIIFYLVKAREYTRMPQVALDRLILGGKEKSRQ
ncbi:hypothetical protein SAMN04488112_12922 [Melghirimyces thermohalophilus]|uniref:Uncharacterized protein n=1 Tax=Melghirimyces thermohalophilus TaxID=1236220 RepID=A0A1G6RMK6_9BACL|nr:hypothetical protein [Melghirimyces thermohalophilus]SDD05900.1 hypothetical protein SAMN04488112_12922 [Melghirimyces thermohalophilus]